MIQERPAGVVFDMDGTLIESERLARACFVQACKDIGWSDIDMEVYNRCVGFTFDKIRLIMLEGYGAEFPVDEMERHWSIHYHRHIEEKSIDIKPGIVELLERLQHLGIPRALATSSRRPTTETKLARTGLDRYFSALVCAGEVARGKPAADPYLLAVEKLGLTPAQCWAVEDSEQGVLSALAAGLRVFQVPDQIVPTAQVRELGHEIVESAADIHDLI